MNVLQQMMLNQVAIMEALNQLLPSRNEVQEDLIRCIEKSKTFEHVAGDAHVYTVQGFTVKGDQVYGTAVKPSLSSGDFSYDERGG